MRRTALAVIVALVLAGGGWVAGQQAQVQPHVPIDPRIVTAADIGFRVEGQTREGVIGTLMVRVNGKWVVAHGAPQDGRVIPLHTK